MKKALFLILIVGFFFRFWQLGKVPGGLTNDEMGYVYNSYSIAETGKNVFGEKYPFLTWVYEKGFPFMPVPTYMMATFFKLVPLSVITSRILSAILGSLDLILIFIFVLSVFKDKKIAIISSFMLAISPWHIFLSRTAYDINFCLFFFLLAIATFVNAMGKTRNLLFSLMFFWLAVFSYRGMSAAFPGAFGSLIIYGILVKKLKRKHIFLLIFGFLLIVSSVVAVSLKNYQRGYLSEAVIDGAALQEQADNQIRESSGPLFVRRIFINKLTIVGKKWVNNYFDGFSTSHLFARGEYGNIVYIPNFGKFYYVDFFLIPFGVYWLIRSQRKGSFFLLMLLFASGLPGLVGGPVYVSHNFLMSVIEPIFVAAGLLCINSAKTKMKAPLMFFMFFVYLFLVGNYLFEYYGRFAKQNLEDWHGGLKDVYTSVSSQKINYQKIVIAPRTWPDVLQYAFWSKTRPEEVQAAWNQGGKYEIGNVVFDTSCRDLPVGNVDNYLIFVYGDQCKINRKPAGLFKDFYGNIRWRIYGKEN